MGRKLNSKTIYDDKYVKPKVKTFIDVVHTNFHDKKIPKENIFVWQ